MADLKAVAFDETSSKRGHNYVTIFIDLDRQTKPVVFATSGKGKETVSRFKDFLLAHGGEPDYFAAAFLRTEVPTLLRPRPIFFANAER